MAVVPLLSEIIGFLKEICEIFQGAKERNRGFYLLFDPNIITSIFQYYQNTENFRLLALGFTTSLAIFEFVSAFENFYNLISNKNK